MQHRTHSHLPPNPTYSPEEAAKSGRDSAAQVLYPLHHHPEVVQGSRSATELLAEAAHFARESGNEKEATRLRCLAEAADYTIADVAYTTATETINLAEWYGEVPDESLYIEITESRESLLSGNEAIKEYLAAHPDEPIEHLLEMLWTAATVNAKEEYGFDLHSMAEKKKLLTRIRGMRGELSFEQILAKFDDIIIREAPKDTEARRDADKRGIDYVIDVYVQPVNELFTLQLDVKNNPEFTLSEEGQRLPGKIWNQCANSEYINNSTTLSPKTVMSKAIPIQKALIEQVSLLDGQRLQAACKKAGISVSDLYVD